MGRGMGDLQKAILTIACEKYRQDAAAYVSAREILVEHYRFPIKGRYVGAGRGSLIFDRKEIGIKRYMSASVKMLQRIGGQRTGRTTSRVWH
jgi:hypothetical protein